MAPIFVAQECVGSYFPPHGIPPPPPTVVQAVVGVLIRGLGAGLPAGLAVVGAGSEALQAPTRPVRPRTAPIVASLTGSNTPTPKSTAAYSQPSHGHGRARRRIFGEPAPQEGPGPEAAARNGADKRPETTSKPSDGMSWAAVDRAMLMFVHSPTQSMQDHPPLQ